MPWSPRGGRVHPTLTLFCGLPGAGKTTLARRLEVEGYGVRLATDEWQARLGVPHADTDLHERLQRVLHEHALDLLRHGVDVVLEDGLWTAAERARTFADARGCSARLVLHVFDVDLDTLLTRLRERNARADPTDHPMTEHALRAAWSVFQPPSAYELEQVDSSVLHGDGSRQP